MEEDGDRGYEVHPALPGEGSGPWLRLTRTSGGWGLAWQDGTGEGLFPLPEGFDPRTDQQLRFWKRAERIEVEWEGRPLGAVIAPTGLTRTGLGACAPCSFEMVRVTAS
jgi:hypothetical protein